MNRYEFSSDKKNNIKKLIELSGLFNGMNEAIDVHIGGLKKALIDAKIDYDAIDRLLVLVNKTFKDSITNDELMNMLIRAHERNMTDDEVIELIEFMESEQMKRMTAKMQKMNNEMVKIGEEWMRRQSDAMNPEIDRIVDSERNRMNQKEPQTSPTPYTSVGRLDKMTEAQISENSRMNAILREEILRVDMPPNY